MKVVRKRLTRKLATLPDLSVRKHIHLKPEKVLRLPDKSLTILFSLVVLSPNSDQLMTLTFLKLAPCTGKIGFTNGHEISWRFSKTEVHNGVGKSPNENCWSHQLAFTSHHIAFEVKEFGKLRWQDVQFEYSLSGMSCIENAKLFAESYVSVAKLFCYCQCSLIMTWVQTFTSCAVSAAHDFHSNGENSCHFSPMFTE